MANLVGIVLIQRRQRAKKLLGAEANIGVLETVEEDGYQLGKEPRDINVTVTPDAAIGPIETRA